MPSLPTVGASAGTWGTELNAWLVVQHNTDGTHPAIPLTFVSPSAGTTAYTLILTDANCVVGLDGSGSPTTLTVPPNSSVAFPQGTMILVRQRGTGTMTVAAGVGVTLRSRGSLLAIAGQYGYATLIKISTDTWDLFGDLA